MWTVIGCHHPIALAQLVRVLDDNERTHAEALHDSRSAATFIAAHALVRLMLSRALPCPPSFWRFAATDLGRPILSGTRGDTDLRYSLSHAGGSVACAVTAGAALGLDLEEPSAMRLLAQASDWLTADEQAWLREGTDRQERALRLWVLKEAYAKATGAGLGVRFDRIGFAFTAAGVCLHDRQEARRWHCLALQSGPDYWLALAVQRSGRRRFAVRRRVLTSADLARDMASATRDSG